MPTRNRNTSVSLKQKLNGHTATIGSWIQLGHVGVAEIMALAGFDWLVVDLEHSVISIETAADLIRVIDSCGVVPLVRLTSNDPNQIKRVMDAGAHGVVVPMVNCAADAAQAVAALHYAPRGTRGVGLARAQGYGNNFKDYLAWLNTNGVVIVQIEHKDAVENLESILSVPGVDGFMIGPYDLSCSLGVAGEFEHPKFLSAIKQIREIGANLGVCAGLHIVEPNLDTLTQTLQEGYRFIVYSVDIRLLDIGVRAGLNHFRATNV